jgi:hypothetical protein
MGYKSDDSLYSIIDVGLSDFWWVIIDGSTLMD